MTTVQGDLLPATRVIHAPLVDSRGEGLGRVDDLIVRLADGDYPPVTGIKANIGGRQLFVPVERLGSVGPGKVQLAGDTLNLARFERRPGEVLLGEDVLGRRLIDVSAGRLVHAHDVELACVDGWWRLVGVDPSRRGVFARLFSGGAAEGPHRARVIDWSDVEPFVGHVPSARLLLPLRRLRRLHPAQIADIVEGASHDEGEEILTAVEADPELEADVFEELDTHHQIEFLDSKPDEEAAEILGEMDPDAAADLLTELDQDRRRPILELLPAEQQRKVLSLLAYNPTTAGGMMTPDFVSVPVDATVAAGLEQVRNAVDLPWQTASMVFLTDADGRLAGSIPLVDLVRADQNGAIRAVLDEPLAVHLNADDDLADVALTMADYNLTAAPVIDGEGHVVGVVTADDLIQAMVPKDWRRRQVAESED
ncbi:MAG TPA: CBS domain-containing protein [Candidatus Dormibacteraeota bacterium]